MLTRKDRKFHSHTSILPVWVELLSTLSPKGGGHAGEGRGGESNTWWCSKSLGSAWEHACRMPSLPRNTRLITDSTCCYLKKVPTFITFMQKAQHTSWHPGWSRDRVAGSGNILLYMVCPAENSGKSQMAGIKVDRARLFSRSLHTPTCSVPYLIHPSSQPEEKIGKCLLAAFITLSNDGLSQITGL